MFRFVWSKWQESWSPPVFWQHGNTIMNRMEKMITRRRWLWFRQGLIKGTILCFRNQPKSKDLNKVPLLLQDLGFRATGEQLDKATISLQNCYEIKIYKFVTKFRHFFSFPLILINPKTSLTIAWKKDN